MASYQMGNVSDSISDIEGYSLYAEAVPGSNGDTGGDPTYNLGADPSDRSSGFNIWDQSVYDGDFNDGFDTNLSAFNFDGGLGTGSNTLSVKSAATISYGSAGSQSVSSLMIRAGAVASGAVAWTSLTIRFYQGGTETDSLTLSQGPAVDTTDPSSSGIAEQILTVTPNASSTAYDRVTISASIRMQTPSGTLPGSDDLFCQVYVMS